MQHSCRPGTRGSRTSLFNGWRANQDAGTRFVFRLARALLYVGTTYGTKRYGIYSPVAQLVEWAVVYRQVGGSNPSLGAIFQRQRNRAEIALSNPRVPSVVSSRDFERGRLTRLWTAGACGAPKRGSRQNPSRRVASSYRPDRCGRFRGPPAVHGISRLNHVGRKSWRSEIWPGPRVMLFEHFEMSTGLYSV